MEDKQVEVGSFVNYETMLYKWFPTLVLDNIWNLKKRTKLGSGLQIFGQTTQKSPKVEDCFPERQSKSHGICWSNATIIAVWRESREWRWVSRFECHALLKTIRQILHWILCSTSNQSNKVQYSVTRWYLGPYWKPLLAVSMRSEYSKWQEIRAAASETKTVFGG